MAAKPLDPAIVAEIQRLAAEGVSRDAIVRQLGCSRHSVTKYAPAGSFDRSKTAAAVAAHTVDMAARRAQLAQDLLDDARRLREQLWQPTTVFNFGGKDNTYNERELDEAPADIKRTLMQASTAALTAHLRLVDHDSDGGLGEARSVLDGFMDTIARRANELGAGDT